jgi:uncharacterized MAPEG superfamily protein
MQTELEILAIYGLLVALTVILQTLGTFQQLGMGYLISSRDEHRTVQGIAARLERAMHNSITALVLFAPAVLLLDAKQAFTPYTLTAAKVFLLARIVYLPAYAFRITGLRTLAWLGGFAATVVLYLTALAYS